MGLGRVGYQVIDNFLVFLSAEISVHYSYQSDNNSSADDANWADLRGFLSRLRRD